jgi:hypothetical protein
VFDINKEVADLICYAREVLAPEKWLAEEVSDLAARIPHLDEISPQAILPLARLVAHGVSEATALARVLDIEQSKLTDYLDALCEFQFAEWTSSGYTATPAGAQAIDAVGQRMVARELFELKRRLEQLQAIRRGGSSS